MDARRGQVYNALFEWQDGELARLSEDRAISLEELAGELNGFDGSCLLVGDGAVMSHKFLSAAGELCRLSPVLMRHQTAYGVALAALSAEPIPAIELEPSYLRPSQAERERGRG